MATHEFTNQASQSERREVLRNDTYFARQSHTVDDAGGRYAKLTSATITGANPSPQYPQLPASSPWSNGFDENVEPPLGYAVDEMPAQETQSSLALSPATVASPVVGDRVKKPVIGSTVASFRATDEPVIGSSIKRRSW